MTTDQWLTALSLVVWPITALIAGTAFVHGVRLLLDGLSGLQIEFFAARRTERRNSLSNTFLMMRQSIPDMVRTCAMAIIEEMGVEELDSARRTAESGLIAMLQARGGIPTPAPNGDPAVRQLVREVRKMYDELDNPTPEPEGKAYVDPDDEDLDPDERILQELFGGGGRGTGDEAEPVELPEEDL